MRLWSTPKRSADLAPLEVHAGGTVAIGDGIERNHALADNASVVVTRCLEARLIGDYSASATITG